MSPVVVHDIALLAIGLAAGIWLDTLVRRSERRHALLIPKVNAWFEPLEAIERFGDPKLLLERTNLRGRVLAAHHSNAIEHLTQLEEEVWKKEQQILDDMIEQLKRGRSTGKGFRQKITSADDVAEIIPLDHWQLLNFDSFDQKRQTISGGGKKYVGLQIGWNENPPL